jgi:hypothetical protein
MEILVTYVSLNQRGQPQRDQRRVAGGSFNIGRGSQCQIHLPDPRVALNHARIMVSDTVATIDAEPGRIQINGRDVDGARLAVGDRIDIGPYVVLVETPPPGYPLALTVTLPVAAASSATRLVPKVLSRLPGISKRRLSYLAFGGVLLVFLLVPILADVLMGRAAPKPDSKNAMMKEIVPIVSAALVQTWNPGPISPGHRMFARTCNECHQKSFARVQDQACVTCHKSVRDHVETGVLPASMVGAPRCAECHREHAGQLRANASACLDCHGNIKTRNTKTTLPDIHDFESDHPAFKLSFRTGPKKEDIQRIPQTDKGKLAEKSGLKFPHNVHVSKRGIKGPNGRVVLDCMRCHAPDDAGLRFKSVNMEEHCGNCHRLEFEPAVTKRQVPHGSERDVMTTLRGFYAGIALGEKPADVVAAQDLAGIKKQVHLAKETWRETYRRETLEWVNLKVAKVAQDVFEERVCSVCHEVASVADNAEVPWKITPVSITDDWLPKSRFDHSKHRTFECAGCHDVAKSKENSDVAIPDIKKCQECHVGSQPAKNKVTSRCESCHGFHVGSLHRGGPAVAATAQNPASHDVGQVPPADPSAGR